MAKGRTRIMGLPVGRAKRPSALARAARVGAVGAVALAAAPAGRRAVEKGRDVVGQAGQAMETAGELKHAVLSHSSTAGKVVGLVGAARRLSSGDGKDKPKLAHLIEEHTDISAPRSVVYNQWTQMEVLPSIVKGVASVDQRGDAELDWTSKIGPVKRSWKAKITEQVPDERIAWCSESGPEHQGVVTFHSLDEELTRVLVEMHYKPSGPMEVVANKLRIQRRRVRRDLRLFKHFIELRGEETGAWRGSLGDSSADRGDGRRAAKARPRSSRAASSSPSTSAGGSGRRTGARAAKAASPTRAKAASKRAAGGTTKRASGSSGRTGAARKKAAS